MAKPIYKSYMGRMTEAWYELSTEQQQQLFKLLDEARTQAGGRGIIICDSSWSSDHYLFFGVEEFPNMEALLQYHDALMKMNWFRYIDGQTLIGTKWE